MDRMDKNVITLLVSLALGALAFGFLFYTRLVRRKI